MCAPLVVGSLIDGALFAEVSPADFFSCLGVVCAPSPPSLSAASEPDLERGKMLNFPVSFYLIRTVLQLMISGLAARRVCPQVLPNRDLGLQKLEAKIACILVYMGILLNNQRVHSAKALGTAAGIFAVLRAV